MAMVAEDIVLYPALPLVARGWKRKQQQPQQQQQQQLPQAEPSIFTCGTCKSVYSSSWFLVQHVQKTHGLKIYEEPSSPRESSPPPNPSPARPIVVQPDKILLNSGTGKDSGPASLTSPFHSGGSKSRSNHGGPVSHRSPTCSPRSGAPSDMFSAFPFMHAGAPRQPATAPVSWASYATRSPTVMSEFAAMMHPELVMEQLRRIQGLTGGDHLSSPFLRSPGLDSAAGQYSHSERLRLLAATGGATSPKHIPRKPDASYTSTPPSAFTTPTTTTTSVTSHHHEKGGSSSSGGRQHKQCELCGKAFRFASNLVLHRRVHSGERPYACPLCAYASGQATALRRHMRSHVTAPADTPAEPHALTDSDIEDTEEFVQREAEAEAAIRQLERDAKTQKEAQDREQEEEPTDLSSNGGRHSVDTAPSPAPLSSQADEEEEEDIVTDRASLLSEVMMKTGLSSLPNYKEAFTAALAEANNAKSPQRSQHSPHTPSSKHDKAEGESQATSPVKVEPHDHDHDSVKDYTDGEVEEEEEKDDAASEGSQRRSPLSRASSELSSTEQPPEKRIKRESSPLTRSPSSTAAAFPGADHLFQRAAMEAAAAQHSIYPGLWFPQTSTAAGPGGLPFSPFMSRGGEHTAAAMMSAAAASSRLQAAAAAAAASSENGLSPQASSAFSNTGGSPKLPSPDPANLSTSAKRRNDTCEFCGKVFKNCSNLTVHRRSHTGEKPYKCQLCPYACAQSSKLTRHMRTHGRHGKDVYRCKFCCMPFSVPSTLEKHMRKCVESQQRAAAAAAAAATRHLTSPLTSAPVV